MAIAMRRYSISFLSRRLLCTTAEASSPLPNPETVPSRISLTLLKSSVSAESDPEKIFALIQSSERFPHFYHGRYLNELTVDKLARAQRHDLVEQLLDTYKSHPAAPKSEGFFIKIMSLYNKALMPDHALRIFEQIPSPTEKSVGAVLTGYLKQRRFDRVRELFDSVPTQYGIVPGVSMYNILLSVLCQEDDVQNARKLLDEMLDVKKVRPNIVSYNTLLSAYSKNDDHAGFDDILEEMSRNGVDHNLVTYNLRIANFCKKGESQKGEELLDDLISKGLYPMPTMFSTIVKGFCKEGHLNAARRVFNRMKKKTRNGDIYVVLLRALVDKEDFTSALPICKELIERGFLPPFEAVKALVNGLVKDSKTEEAKDLVEKMRKVASRNASDSWSKVEAELPL